MITAAEALAEMRRAGLEGVGKYLTQAWAAAIEAELAAKDGRIIELDECIFQLGRTVAAKDARIKELEAWLAKLTRPEDGPPQ